jgi:hypothetical protein
MITVQEIYTKAKLTDAESGQMSAYIDGDLDFYGTSAYEKLYEYFTFETGQMPYGTAKARDGDPDLWILDEIENMSLSET